eukprot:PhM_4_TR17589/c0_g1_i1/m.14215
MHAGRGHLACRLLHDSNLPGDLLHYEEGLVLCEQKDVEKGPGDALDAFVAFLATPLHGTHVLRGLVHARHKRPQCRDADARDDGGAQSREPRAVPLNGLHDGLLFVETLDGRQWGEVHEGDLGFDRSPDSGCGDPRDPVRHVHGEVHREGGDLSGVEGLGNDGERDDVAELHSACVERLQIVRDALLRRGRRPDRLGLVKLRQQVQRGVGGTLDEGSAKGQQHAAVTLHKLHLIFLVPGRRRRRRRTTTRRGCYGRWRRRPRRSVLLVIILIIIIIVQIKEEARAPGDVVAGLAVALAVMLLMRRRRDGVLGVVLDGRAAVLPVGHVVADDSINSVEDGTYTFGYPTKHFCFFFYE